MERTKAGMARCLSRPRRDGPSTRSYIPPAGMYGRPHSLNFTAKIMMHTNPSQKVGRA
jgi:hypothetical protein